MQRLDEERSPVGGHLDVSSQDRSAEVERHRTLGATVREATRYFTVLTDPSGTTYCVTDRDPVLSST